MGGRAAMWHAYLTRLFALLADVWNCTLTTGTIPTPWLHIRTVFIEKLDGGLRPISIASAFWRLGISAILHGLLT